LGNWGEKVAFTSTILGAFGAILAYLIVGGEFLTELLSPTLGGNLVFWTIIYFLAGAILIFFGIKAVSKIEFWGLILFFFVLILIFLRGKYLISIENLFIGNWKLEIGNFFLPYGAILFSLWGASLIPEVEEMLETKKNLLKTVIMVSILIAIFVYLFFIYLILGITGSQTTESALIGLQNILTDRVVVLALIFGLLTTFTSFIALGLTLKKVFWYDLKINKNLAWAITCFLPLVLFLIGVRQFIPVISFIGGIMLGVDGILILLMYQKKIKNQKSKTKNLLVYPSILILFGGIIYEIIYFLK
jgi:amino acid permease